MAETFEDFLDNKSLEELKKEIISLKRENKAALTTIQKLLKDLNKKSEEIQNLQKMVSHNVPVVQPEKKKLTVDITPEEEIAHTQLDRLRKLAQTRALTLEETKIYDLLVKNKRLSQDESTVNLSKASYREVLEVDLLQIASQKDDSNKSDK